MPGGPTVDRGDHLADPMPRASSRAAIADGGPRGSSGAANRSRAGLRPVVEGQTGADHPATTHGAYSMTKSDGIARRARNEKRRILDRLQLRQRDLDPIGVSYLDHYAKLRARIDAIDAYVDEHGLVRADGEPQPVMRLYVALQNSARLALGRLEGHLKARAPEPGEALRAYLDHAYPDVE